MLLDSGVNIDVRDDNGTLPLIVAAGIFRHGRRQAAAGARRGCARTRQEARHHPVRCCSCPLEAVSAARWCCMRVRM